jgi:hypothetical protein
MRARVSVALLLAAAGCSDAPPPADRPAGNAAEHVEETGPGARYALVVGGDTLAFERFVREDGLLQGEIVDHRNDRRLEYRADIDGSERIRRLEIALYADGRAAPERRAVGEFHGDSLVVELHGEGPPQVRSIGTPPGVLLHIGPSVATLEQLIRRAAHLGGEQVQVAVLLIATDGDDDHRLFDAVTVTRTGGASAHVFLDELNQARARLDGAGRIIDATNPALGAISVRVPDR